MTKTIHQLPRVPGARLPTERVRDAKFAKNLQRLMAEREMTQSKVAEQIWGRTKNAKGYKVARGRDRLSVWVSGKNFPDRENLEKLARALRVPVSELAPEAELKAAHRGAADYSFTRASDRPGVEFVQIAQFLPTQIAHEIHALLLKAEQELEQKSLRETTP